MVDREDVHSLVSHRVHQVEKADKQERRAKHDQKVVLDKTAAIHGK